LHIYNIGDSKAAIGYKCKIGDISGNCWTFAKIEVSTGNIW